MSHIALTASATATVVASHRRAKQWSTLFPSCWRSRGTNSSLVANSPRKRLQLRFLASGENGGNGGVGAEISETEKAPANFVWSDNKKPRVCILGGGFGGLYTALRLESLEWPDDKKPQIALVDQSERFVFKPMLYELLTGEVDEWEIAPRFSDLLANTSVQFFKDRVKFLHPSDHWGMNGSKASSCGGTVHLESGLLIEYDWLVLALGAEAKLDVVPGAAEFAIPFSTLEDALKVNNKLTTLERKTFGKDFQISVAVVGCGYSGVELAATVAERLQNRGIVRAINVATTICPNAPPGNREAALKVLSSRKVELLLGYFVRCIRRVSELESSDTLTGVDENCLVVHDFEKYILELQPAEREVQSKIIEADLVLWTVGSKPPLPQLEPSDAPFVIPLNARGQAETDETLRVKGHPRIFALGDSSALRDSNGRILPATAQVAFQQADFTGWNLWAAINGRPLLPFRFQNLGEMMTLGRNDAAISPSFVEGLTLEGPIGHTARKIAYLIRLPTDEHRLKVGISWLTKSAIDSVSSLQSTLSRVLSGS
ncbi:alternative NAD(P)H-ubiquinone oxidoreductase C1, chloroplastic/mitochondrial [Gastrolobium bilobum]|uniref:alternative NAD(P)H-ubiquinone oxidoreductase C1, chloroplastic/mitochondrial n=1 Tax=Gastrolobium bilobum TaxID=150636 RepID=UPI002AB0D93D|nr:alternative NAD(P)H-ubiquinone oxidoreductase C1, chloroplastic/mitochondrial [Gastrolobium bilobum]XP_061346848.1 alternative NAD(P)H-ubiquinone oxidoreductase C1, chloroplastic/mitochondrial [Gastrolobium bilobum]